jgi:hypothetical protein
VVYEDSSSEPLMMDQESTIYFGGNFMSAYFLSSPCVYSVLFEDEAAT